MKHNQFSAHTSLAWIKRKAPARNGLSRIWNTVKEYRSWQRRDLPRAPAVRPAMPVGRLARRAEYGDTIVEVMVAAALVMATLGIGYALSRQGLRQTTDDTLRNQAISYGQSQIEFIRNAITNYHPGATLFSATGGTITTSGGYTIHTFTGSGTFTPNSAINVEALVVAGGGGGGPGDNGNAGGGGGGAGGVNSGSVALSSASPVTVTVGNGGGSEANGGNSSFGGYIYTTGGGGGAKGNGGNLNPGGNGGSGGGGARSGVGGSGISPQGSNGGAGTSAGGGGGGWGAAGAAGGATNGGNGGGGNNVLISGSSVYYGGGGGGGRRDTSGVCGSGGIGGGGPGGGGPGVCLSDGRGTSGVANTGGGGGGGGGGSGVGTPAGSGGSGIVIVRYIPPSLTFDPIAPNTLLDTYRSGALSAGFCILNSGQAQSTTTGTTGLCSQYTGGSSIGSSPISIKNTYDAASKVFTTLVQWAPIGTTRDATSKQQLTLYYKAP